MYPLGLLLVVLNFLCCILAQETIIESSDIDNVPSLTVSTQFPSSAPALSTETRTTTSTFSIGLTTSPPLTQPSLTTASASIPNTATIGVEPSNPASPTITSSRIEQSTSITSNPETLTTAGTRSSEILVPSASPSITGETKSTGTTMGPAIIVAVILAALATFGIFIFICTKFANSTWSLKFPCGGSRRSSEEVLPTKAKRRTRTTRTSLSSLVTNWAGIGANVLVRPAQATMSPLRRPGGPPGGRRPQANVPSYGLPPLLATGERYPVF